MTFFWWLIVLVDWVVMVGKVFAETAPKIGFFSIVEWLMATWFEAAFVSALMRMVCSGIWGL